MSVFTSRETLEQSIESGRDGHRHRFTDRQIADMGATLDHPEFDDMSVQERRSHYNSLSRAPSRRSGPGTTDGLMAFSIILLIIGLIVCFAALNMETTVPSFDSPLGSGTYNIGLQQQQMMMFLSGGLTTLVSIVLMAAAIVRNAVLKISSNR